MPRFYIPPHAWNPDKLALDAGETHHALDVLRLQPGAHATVFDGQGAEATVEIASVQNGKIALKKISITKSAPLACKITLGQAIPKGKNMDLIVEKATELGASAIAPLLVERTVVNYDDADAVAKRDKWQRVAVEAAKQCGQNWLPVVAKPQPLKAFFQAGGNYDLRLVASLQPDSRHLKQVLADLGQLPLSSVLILVGPEGDFTPAEMNLAKNAGCRPITLGPIILRSETAAIYCMSVLSHELFTR